MAKPRRYTRAFAEAQAKQGNANEMIATSIYITLQQLEKVDRLISKRQKEESTKLGRRTPPMSFTDFIRFVIDELPE